MTQLIRRNDSTFSSEYGEFYGGLSPHALKNLDTITWKHAPGSGGEHWTMMIQDEDGNYSALSHPKSVSGMWSWSRDILPMVRRHARLQNIYLPGEGIEDTHLLMDMEKQEQEQMEQLRIMGEPVPELFLQAYPNVPPTGWRKPRTEPRP